MFFLLIVLQCLALCAASEFQCIEPLVFSEPACNRTCSSLGEPFDDNCLNDSGVPCKCPIYVNNKNECVDWCDPEEVLCKSANQTYLCNKPCAQSCSTMYGKACWSMCSYECACSYGYVKNASGVCILPQDCDRSEIVCPTPTYLNPCGNGILPTCYQSADDKDIDESICIPTCSCPENMVFDSYLAKCIDPRMCYDSEENEECIALFGDQSTYICNEDVCDCGCYEGSIFNQETLSCKECTAIYGELSSFVCNEGKCDCECIEGSFFDGDKCEEI